MIYYLYKSAEGRPVVSEYRLMLSIYPGFELLEEIESNVRPNFDYKRWIDGKWIDENPIPQNVVDRIGSYPAPIALLEMLWDAMDTGQIPKAIAFYNAIKAVKDKYP